MHDVGAFTERATEVGRFGALAPPRGAIRGIGRAFRAHAAAMSPMPPPLLQARMAIDDEDAICRSAIYLHYATVEASYQLLCLHARRDFDLLAMRHSMRRRRLKAALRRRLSHGAAPTADWACSRFAI